MISIWNPLISHLEYHLNINNIEDSPKPPEVTVPTPVPAPEHPPASKTTSYNVLHPDGNASHPFSHPHDWNTVIGGLAQVQPAVTVLTVTQSMVMQVEQTLAVEMMMGHSETGVGLSVGSLYVVVTIVVAVGDRRGLVSGMVMMLVAVEVGRD